MIDQVPKILYPLLKAPGNVILKPAPANENPVLASRLAKLALYDSSIFEKTIYMDFYICLLDHIKEVFDYLEENDLLITEDVEPIITKASNLLRDKNQEDI